LTLADAEATVMALTLPQYSPRIERAGFIGGADAIAALESAQVPDIALLQRQHDLRSHLIWGGGYNAIGDPGGPLAIVERSQLGMDVMGVGVRHLGQWPPGQVGHCGSPPADQRYSVTVVIDPRSAHTIGHIVGAMPDALWAVASPDVPHVRVTATPWPSLTPSATPEARVPASPLPMPSPTLGPLVALDEFSMALGRGEYPSGLREAIAAWPLVVGSTWTYRATAHTDALGWSTGLVTETVVEATRHGGDLMEAVVTGSRISLSASSQRTTIVVRPDGVFVARYPHRHPRPQLNRAEALATRAVTDAGRLDGPLMQIVSFPLAVQRAAPQAFSLWSVIGIEVVPASAGVFPSCFQVSEVISAGSMAGRWLCPGVGFARHELSICSTSYGGYSVLDLVDYTIPPLVVVE